MCMFCCTLFVLLSFFLLANVLSVLLRFTDSDYPFCIFKFVLTYTNCNKPAIFWCKIINKNIIECIKSRHTTDLYNLTNTLGFVELDMIQIMATKAFRPLLQTLVVRSVALKREFISIPRWQRLSDDCILSSTICQFYFRFFSLMGFVRTTICTIFWH
jgi:hypothetical protein